MKNNNCNIECKEVSDIVTIGTLYIKKYAMDKPAKKIFVQIEKED